MRFDSDKPTLRVLQILPALEEGGAERGTVEVAQHLRASGHRADVASAGGRMVADLVHCGAHHTLLKIGKKSPLGLLQVPRLRRLILETRPQILHLRSRFPAWLAWFAWRSLDALDRPRLVTTVHGLHEPARYSAILTRGERVIAVSETVRRHLETSYPGFDGERLRTVPRGVDPDAYPFDFLPDPGWLARWRRDHPQLDGRFVLTSPGRLSRSKGHRFLIEAVAELNGRGIPTFGLVIGSTPGHRGRSRARIEELATRLGVGDRILLLGHRDDLREILSVSSVVLSLSTRPEAFGRTTLEALALGRPVVGWNHGGVAEQLGQRFPEGQVALGDFSALVERLDQFSRDSIRPESFRPPSLRDMVEGVVAVYRELVPLPSSQSVAG